MGKEVITKYNRYFENDSEFDRPKRITVEISSRCNLNCSICPRSYLQGKGSFRQGDMSVELFKKVIDEISSYPANTLVPFFRGEALMNRHFLEMVTYAVDKGVGPIQLASNAMLLEPDISRRLIELGLDFISFSLDAQGKENYEKIRCGAVYEIVLQNIETFLRIKADAAGERPVVQVSAVKTVLNEEKMPDFINYWRNKVERVRIYPEHSKGGRFGSLKKSGGKYERKPCLKLLTDMVVYWNGYVGICNHDWEGKCGLGNVMEQSLSKIWQGALYHHLRKSQWENMIPESSPCYHCDQWKVYYTKNNIIGELYE